MNSVDWPVRRLLTLTFRQAPNKQLQRTVTRRRVRAAGAALSLCACGAHDTPAPGR